MPIVEIHMLEGRTDEMKEKLISSITQAVHDSLQVPASQYPRDAGRDEAAAFRLERRIRSSQASPGR